MNSIPDFYVVRLSPQGVEKGIVFRLELLDGNYVCTVFHLTLAAQHIHRKLVGSVAGEELARLHQRVMYGGLAVLCVAILDQKVVNSLRNLGGPVEPADAYHQIVSFAPLKLGYVADVEGLVGTLALDEDAVARLVLDVVVVAAVAQILARAILPGLALARLAFT